jgi:error-prone DNA polymerase
MVHPYLRRRKRSEKVSYPSPSPSMATRTNCARSAQDARRAAVPGTGDADRDRGREIHRRGGQRLRRAMATFRNVGTIGKFEDKMIGNMIARGYDPEFAKSCFDQIKGFGSTAFRKAMPRVLRSSSMSRHG